MSSINDLLELLENAEELDQLATARHLYEMIMMEDEADENHAATLMYVANLVDLGDLNHAEATLLRIEDEIPEDLSAAFLSQRGDLQSYRGNYAEAEKDYREANKIDSNQGEYLVFAAQAAFQQGEVARAEYLIREAIAIGGEVLDEDGQTSYILFTCTRCGLEQTREFCWVGSFTEDPWADMRPDGGEEE